MVASEVLSQDEINTGAIKFSERWKGVKSEKSEAQTFINEFFQVFGLDRKSVAKLEEHPDSSGDFMDCLWKAKFMIEMKSFGENLDKAMDQALDYYLQLKKDEEPRYILVCDFEHWYLRDKKENTDHFFILSELVGNIGLFGFMTNRAKLIRADPVNLQASEILGKIFDMLKVSDYGTHHTEYFLTRLVFCLFADDTGIFGDHGKFQSYIKNSTQEDGSDLGRYLAYLFGVLNQDSESRSKTMDSKTRSFPYINGALFEKPIEFPDFNAKMRELLIQAGNYDWSKVSPAIFGNMFQTVMDQDARRAMGAHYTSEENILKVIRPLFLDKLNDEYDEINKIADDIKKDRFIEFQNKLASLKFLDPACGSGNFLIVAYREIRRLEHRAIMKIYGYEGKRIDTDQLSKVNVDQFYGIEIIEFSSRIAETSLWMMDHIMNVELSHRYGYKFRRIPITKKPTIANRDALEFDWNDLLPPDQCYCVLGNPPFSGSAWMNKEQKEQTIAITNSAVLDYVTNWFVKAANYISDNTMIGFVSTNSIVQGKQVEELWSILSSTGVDIEFAYDSFEWKSEARSKAHVIVVILGLTKKPTKQRRLFTTVDTQIVETNPPVITPNLKESNTKQPIVKGTSKSLNGLPKMKMGTQPIDGKIYMFDNEQLESFLKAEPDAKPYVKPFVDGKSFINSTHRWIFDLRNIEPHALKQLHNIQKLVERVREFRLTSTRPETVKLAETPKLYAHTCIPQTPFLAIPKVSSSRRKYVPIDYMKPPVIPSDKIMCIENATYELFALLTSNMHMLWLKGIGGRLKSDHSYSISVVYNTFPVPKDYLTLKQHGQKILEVRALYHDSTLADLYDPITMPSDLQKAHDKLDRAVEKLYRKELFKSDAERLEFLLEEYQKMTLKQTTL